MKIADKLYKVFVVAGSEPLGTAGIQADMKAIRFVEGMRQEQ